MTEIQKKLNDSPIARWSVLAIVSVTMMCGYFITDVMAPLQTMLEETFGWDGTEYGLFTGAYGWFNVFLFMLIIGGVILDKKGMRFTGTLACVLMIAGCAVKYYAISPFFSFDGYMFGIRWQVLLACFGFALFGVGVEIAGITVTKVIARWFKGKEIALAMGLQVATARIGTSLAFSFSVPLAKKFHDISAPVLFGLAILCVGLLSFIVFCVMDRKLDRSIRETNAAPEESFRLQDIRMMVRIKGFWLIAILCVLFYSAIFPFLKFATSLMINKYGISEDWAGYVPSLISLGAIILTPIFGGIYDRVGKGASIMFLGSFLLILVHVLFALPVLNVWWFAAAVMVILGVAFSLVPSAMWPSVPKIIPQRQLGSAYATIFYVQNIGLAGVPTLIGWVLAKYCTTGNPDAPYDYTLPMIIFSCFGVAASFVAYLLKKEDKKNGYGLESPNFVTKK
ncbi:MAG: MFS transporter [Tannerella sp.]|jgi:MFS family permease|nr:MFS transporter [Tannerella sp.]